LRSENGFLRMSSPNVVPVEHKQVESAGADSFCAGASFT
jgi:hypothetical protein